VNDRVKAGENEDRKDLPAWQWLQRMIVHLDKDGMSSDESEDEEKGPKSFRVEFKVKNMPWRRDITKELAIVDAERMTDRDVYHPQGSKPAPRVRLRDAPITSRHAPCGLPRSLYDDNWLEAQLPATQRELRIAKRDFEWVNIEAE
jgi:hypothetical protein